MEEKDKIMKEIKDHEVDFQIISEDIALIENHLAKSH